MAYIDLPQEMRVRRQWCITGPDKQPYCVGDNGYLENLSVHENDKFLTFEQAVHYTGLFKGSFIGFILMDTDPFACIDLDVKGPHNAPDKPHTWTTPEELDRYIKITEAFPSYTEVSISGQSLHIWVKANIGLGCRRDGVEVYSQERMLVCTGNVYRGGDIVDCQEMLESMVIQMRKGDARQSHALADSEQTHDDSQVWEMLNTAGNADKFRQLSSGNWQEEFPSQSEADLAVMSMIAFFTPNNEQSKRLFRVTQLGQREKATKNDRYLDFTLETIRSRMYRENAVSETARDLARSLVMELQNKGSFGTQQNINRTVEEKIASLPEVPDGEIDWPPGFAGALAQFVYSVSVRPIREVSIMTAIAFLAGVCGRTWNISNTGLNMYIIVVARSGIGKEALHTGLSLLSRFAPGFIDFQTYASGPALTKRINAPETQMSITNVVGEFGKRLRKMSADERNEGPLSTLRSVMMDIYMKSGKGSTVGGMSYSNKDNNTEDRGPFAYSMIGESTPKTLYEALTETMMEDGFLSRFLIVDYKGDRPPPNKENIDMVLDTHLRMGIDNIVNFANNAGKSEENIVEVGYEPEALKLLDSFSEYCDSQIDGKDDESYRQMWNRAHIKALRLSALLCIPDNVSAPKVKEEYALWAIDLVQKDIALMSARIKSGDVGLDDNTRERKMLTTLRDFISKPVTGYNPSMAKDGIVPYRYIQQRLAAANCFKLFSMGASRGISTALQICMDSGYIQEVDKMTLSTNHGYNGRAFRVLTLPNLSED